MSVTSDILLFDQNIDHKSLTDQGFIKVLISAYKIAFYEVGDEQT